MNVGPRKVEAEMADAVRSRLEAIDHLGDVRNRARHDMAKRPKWIT
jgi:hypothetical protein